MNSQNHEHQKNNLKNVSKSKIIYLGILASLFVNTTVANGWQTMEFDFNNQASGTTAFNPAFPFNMASIFFNFGTDGATAGEKTYYFDNVSYGTPLLQVSQFTASNVKMYPNPTSTIFTMEAQTIIENVAVYNVLGQEVLVKNPNASSVRIDLSDLQAGVYIVKTIIEGNQSSSRIIKK